MLPARRTARDLWSDPFEFLHRDFDGMLRRWFPIGEDLTAAYPVDITEDENHIHVEAEVPGFQRDEVNVTLENGILTITAERKPEETKGESHLRERRYTRLTRSFSLPNTVDEDKVDAKLADGVLKLTLHKREEVKPRRIEVK